MSAAPWIHFVVRSRNGKIGPIPATTSPMESCPDTCALKWTITDEGERKAGPCYALAGAHMRSHWQKVTDRRRGQGWRAFLAFLAGLSPKQVWRHNQAGELANRNGVIDRARLVELARVNAGRPALIYSHLLPEVGNNLAAIEQARALGLTINLSTDNVPAAIRARRRWGLPVVTLLPMDAPNVQTVDGQKIVACPAEKSDRITCANCGLCALGDREYVIGFRVHGPRKRLAAKVALVA